jgi:hypothetical protein
MKILYTDWFEILVHSTILVFSWLVSFLYPLMICQEFSRAVITIIISLFLDRGSDSRSEITYTWFL